MSIAACTSCIQRREPINRRIVPRKEARLELQIGLFIVGVYAPLSHVHAPVGAAGNAPWNDLQSSLCERRGIRRRLHRPGYDLPLSVLASSVRHRYPAQRVDSRMLQEDADLGTSYAARARSREPPRSPSFSFQNLAKRAAPSCSPRRPLRNAPVAAMEACESAAEQGCPC